MALAISMKLIYNRIVKSVTKFAVLWVIIGISCTTCFCQSTRRDVWAVHTTDTSNYTPAYLGNGMVGSRSQKDGLSVSRIILNGFYD